MTTPNDPVATTLKDFIFLDKYARKRPDGMRETWDDAVARVRDMHRRRYPQLDTEIVDAFELVRQRRVMPSMRSMQFGGLAQEVNHTRGYNCLKSDTPFVTREGVRTFDDVDHGDEVEVLTHTGRWQKAIVRNYGRQRLNKITIRRGGNWRRDVFATANHRWILRSGEVTTDLRVDDRLMTAPPVFGEFDFDYAEPEEQLYWAYGFVYGDGTIVNGSKSMVRLCGPKTRFRSRFESLGFKTSAPLSCGGDFMAFTGSYLKELPNPAVDNPALIRAFVAGYLDADGSRDNGRIIGIQTSSDEAAEFIRTCFPIAGAFILSERRVKYDTNFGHVDGVLFRLAANVPERTTTPFVVEAIEPADEEQVWCLEVEEDASFVLPYGLVTGNCAATAIDRVDAFAEYFYLLLCGCGVGISVQREHIAKLPPVTRPLGFERFVVEDTIEGWADAAQALMRAYLGNGARPEFDYSLIRPEGSPIVTGGGLAPGPEPLRRALNEVRTLLEFRLDPYAPAQGLLRPIDAYDICMHLSGAVMAGGVRRSATAVLFSPDDTEMLAAKTGDWHRDNPQRARSNNSAVLNRAYAYPGQFEGIFRAAREWGEPGFYFTDDPLTHLTNPCYEIGLVPFTDDGRSGVAFCNLTTINGAACRTADDFYRACEAASLIGTLQAGYTDFPYLSEESREIARRDALLGVSICGFLDHPALLLNADVLRRGAHVVRESNMIYADAIVINPAARLTCVKPDGTVSLALGLDVAGIHPAHARRYLRRIRCAANNPVFEAFRATNPHAVERDTMDPTGKTWIAVFPVDVDDDATLRTDIDAATFLRNVVTVQRNWVDPGTVRGTHRHAVSNTCTVRGDEWELVEQTIWDNRDEIAAVSLLSEVGDKVYPQAPREAVMTPQDYEVWEHLREHWRTPDWSDIAGSAAIEPAQACAGGMCEI